MTLFLCVLNTFGFSYRNLQEGGNNESHYANAIHGVDEAENIAFLLYLSFSRFAFFAKRLDVAYVPSKNRTQKSNWLLLSNHSRIRAKTFCNLLVGLLPMFGYNCSGLGTP